MCARSGGALFSLFFVRNKWSRNSLSFPCWPQRSSERERGSQSNGTRIICFHDSASNSFRRCSVHPFSWRHETFSWMPFWLWVGYAPFAVTLVCVREFFELLRGTAFYFAFHILPQVVVDSPFMGALFWLPPSSLVAMWRNGGFCGRFVVARFDLSNDLGEKFSAMSIRFRLKPLRTIAKFNLN